MISNIEGNKFIDANKNERFLLELLPPDIEQQEPFQIVSSIEMLKRELNLLKANNVLKIYHLDGKTYIDSEINQNSLSYFDSKSFLEGLEPFIMGENVYSNPLFKDDYCKINGKYLRFVSISLNEDHQIDVGDIQKFGNYQISFKKVKTVFSKILVNDARKMSHSALYDALSDIEGIEAFKENEQMLRKIVTREEELFKTEVIFIIKSETELSLQRQTEDLIENLEIVGLSPRIETASLNIAFKNYIPGVSPKFQKPLLFHTSLLANSLPIHKDSLMKQGTTFHSRSGTEIYFDSKIGDSFSATFTGLTGNGKTVLVQKILNEELNTGRKCFVIDPKHDYRKFAALKNAYVIAESINPMIFSDPMYLRNMILSKIPKNERTALWEGKLLRAIRDTGAYNCKNFFKALEKIKTKGFDDLEYYFEDIREKISEKKTELADFAYLEMESFTNETIPFLLSFAFEYVKKLGSPYNLVIDEAHRVFKHDPTFLEERVREMRVQGSGLFTITQKYKDLLSSYFGEVVADNSFHKFFFSQQLELEKGITLFDQMNINSLRTKQGEYSEFYYKSENHKKIMRYYPTIKELEVFKSGNIETDKMMAFIKSNREFYSVDECIDQWIRGKYAL